MTAALGCFSGLYAQDTMTLKECMQYAVENSAKMKLQQMDVDDARVAHRDAILRVFTPEVSAGTYAYSNFGRSVDPETNTYVSTTSFNNGYQVGAGITLFDGFSAVNNMKVSKTALKMGIDQEEHGFKDNALGCIGNVFGGGYELDSESLYFGSVSCGSSG